MKISEKIQRINSKGAILGVILASLAVAAVSSKFNCGENNTVPQDLIGVWKTDAPKYADRFFEITEDQITFGIGGGDVDVWPIKRIEENTNGQIVSYKFYYTKSGLQDYRLEFDYEQKDENLIRFSNQKTIEWRKVRN